MSDYLYKGIIFDFDGTLVNTEPIYYRANREAFEPFGHIIDENEYYHYWSLLGLGSKGEIRRHDLNHIDPDIVKRSAREIYHRLVQTESVPLMPFARDMLAGLQKQGFHMVIASNTEKSLITRILQNEGLADFNVHVIGGDIHAAKPAPDIFLAAVSYLNIQKEHCLVLEDTDKGVRAARAAGLDFAVIHSPLYPQFNPGDAVAKLPSLEDFYHFVTNMRI